MEDMELTLERPIEKDRNRITIYDTQTGEPSVVMVTMLPQQLRKIRPDGSQVFTTIKPDIEPKRGNLKCLLHPDSPDRKYYDSLGLPTCGKSNLTARLQVLRHMQKRHKMEWQTIEQDKKDNDELKRQMERQEDRKFQKEILKSKK